MNDDIRWLTVAEAAAYASLGKTTIYRAVRSGQLRAARMGKPRALGFLGTLDRRLVDGVQCRTG
jgi:excisionase family DNA binding protein